MSTTVSASTLAQHTRSQIIDLPDDAREIFLRKPLDRLLVICPSRQMVTPDDAILSLPARQINTQRPARQLLDQ